MVKQVIVIRKDLKMRRGKEIAQGAHASIAFLTRNLHESPPPDRAGYTTTSITLTRSAREWIESSFTKVCLQVDSKEELLEVYDKAKEAGLEVHLVIDAGRTEFDGVPTETCLAIGPNDSDAIDQITGNLKLY